MWARGQQFSNYRLLKKIGGGGFADVYLGEHVHRITNAAVKVLKIVLASDNVKDFLNEARAFRLKHPNIIETLDFGVEGDTPYLVMTYVPNGSLGKYHQKGVPLALTTIVSYVKQIASALQYELQEAFEV